MSTLISRNGILYLDFRFAGKRCREVTKLTDNPANRKKCEKLLSRIDAEIMIGTFDYERYFPNGGQAAAFRNWKKRTARSASGEPLFTEFAETWFAEKRPEWRKSYADTVRLTLNKYLLPSFGEIPVHAIDKASILAFRGRIVEQPGIRKGSKISAARVNKVMQPLQMIIVEAASRFNFANPWVNIKPIRQAKPVVDPFTIAEVNAILGAVRPDLKNYYVTRFFTGLRTSEIHGLRWQNVDFERRQILVREALVQGQIEQTKTNESTREIDMNQLVYEALMAQSSATSALGDYVFCHRNGTPLNNRNITKRIWYPLLDLLNIRKRRPYQTRHTAATLWLASGENPEWIAKQMGHTTTEMLFKVYSRFVPNLTRHDGSAFERLLAAEFASKLGTSSINSGSDTPRIKWMNGGKPMLLASSIDLPARKGDQSLNLLPFGWSKINVVFWTLMSLSPTPAQ